MSVDSRRIFLFFFLFKVPEIELSLADRSGNVLGGNSNMYFLINHFVVLSEKFPLRWRNSSLHRKISSASSEEKFSGDLFDRDSFSISTKTTFVGRSATPKKLLLSVHFPLSLSTNSSVLEKQSSTHLFVACFPFSSVQQGTDYAEREERKNKKKRGSRMMTHVIGGIPKTYGREFFFPLEERKNTQREICACRGRLIRRLPTVRVLC